MDTRSPLDVLRKEAGELEEEASALSYAHRESSRRWEKRHLQLGLPSAVLAAVAGVTAFTALPDYITGGTALVVAVLATVNTFLSPGDRSSAHQAAHASFNRLRRQANMLKDVDVPFVDSADREAVLAIKTQVLELSTEIGQIEESAPSLSHSARQVGGTRSKSGLPSSS